MGQHFLRTGKPYRTGKELIHPALEGINWTNTVGHRFCAPWNDFLVCNNSYQSPSRVPGRTKEPMVFPFRRRQQEGQKRHIHPSLAAVPNVPPSIMSLQARPWSAPLSTGTIAQRQRSGTLFFKLRKPCAVHHTKSGKRPNETLCIFRVEPRKNSCNREPKGQRNTTDDMSFFVQKASRAQQTFLFAFAPFTDYE